MVGKDEIWMWLFTTFGFFSAVQKPGDDYLTLRARVTADLDRLRATHLPELSPTLHGAGTDYPYRATIGHAAFGRGLVRLADNLHYANFKDAVAATQGQKRASIYGQVWAELLRLEEMPPPHPEPTPDGSAPLPPAYGGVVIDDAGRVLLHEPRDHFGGYHWTFPKGRPLPGEEPRAAALREVREETGVGATWRADVPGLFGGTTTETSYFLLSPVGEAGRWNGETSAIRWVTRDEAARLLALTTTSAGRERDLRVLAAAFALHEALRESGPPAPGVGVDNARFHVVGDGARLVEGWSIARLPFMPTNWREGFRQRLRDAVRHLVAAPGQLLHATLTSPDTGMFDAENILLYNVDLGRLAAASRYGIRFERALASPPVCPLDLSDKPAYYHRYALAPAGDSFRHWTAGPVLVRWRCTLPTPAAAKRWQTVWYALKRGEIAVADSGASLAGGYGLRVTLRAPVPGTPRAIDLIKPLFDGVVTALHRHDGTAETEICARLAAMLNTDPGDIARLLQEERGTVLGLRRLIFLFGAGLMANPQDDLCFAGQLLLERVEPTAPCELLVEVLAITPRGVEG